MDVDHWPVRAFRHTVTGFAPVWSGISVGRSGSGGRGCHRPLPLPQPGRRCRRRCWPADRRPADPRRCRRADRRLAGRCRAGPLVTGVRAAGLMSPARLASPIRPAPPVRLVCQVPPTIRPVCPTIRPVCPTIRPVCPLRWAQPGPGPPAWPRLGPACRGPGPACRRLWTAAATPPARPGPAPHRPRPVPGPRRAAAIRP